MIFRFKEKDYTGATALEIVRKLEMDTKNYPFRGQSTRQFLGEINEIFPLETSASSTPTI